MALSRALVDDPLGTQLAGGTIGRPNHVRRQVLGYAGCVLGVSFLLDLCNILIRKEVMFTT